MAKKSNGKGIGLDVAMPMTSPRAHKSAMNEEMRYRAEDDLRTLRRAEEIRSDTARVRMAKQVAAMEIKALAKVAK